MKIQVSIDLRLKSDERFLATLQQKIFVPFVPAEGHVLEFSPREVGAALLRGPDFQIAQFDRTYAIKIRKVSFRVGDSHFLLKCDDVKLTMDSFSEALNSLVADYGFSLLRTDHLWASMLKRC